QDELLSELLDRTPALLVTGATEVNADALAAADGDRRRPGPALKDRRIRNRLAVFAEEADQAGGQDGAHALHGSKPLTVRVLGDQRFQLLFAGIEFPADGFELVD